MYSKQQRLHSLLPNIMRNCIFETREKDRMEEVNTFSERKSMSGRTPLAKSLISSNSVCYYCEHIKQAFLELSHRKRKDRNRLSLLKTENAETHIASCCIHLGNLYIFLCFNQHPHALLRSTLNCLVISISSPLMDFPSSYCIRVLLLYRSDSFESIPITLDFVVITILNQKCVTIHIVCFEVSATSFSLLCSIWSIAHYLSGR